MAATRLAKAVKELNISIERAVQFLSEKGYEVNNHPNAKLTEEELNVLIREFGKEVKAVEEAKKVSLPSKDKRDDVKLEDIDPLGTRVKDNASDEEVLIRDTSVRERIELEVEATEVGKEASTPTKEPEAKLQGPKILGKINIEEKKKPAKKESTTEPVAPAAQKVEEKEEAAVVQETEEKPLIKTTTPTITGPKVIDKIELPKDDRTRRSKTKTEEPVEGKEGDSQKEKSATLPGRKRPRKRKILRSRKSDTGAGKSTGKHKRKSKEQETHQITEKEIQEKIKETLQKMHTGGGVKRPSRPKKTREQKEVVEETESTRQKILEVTEFISVSELANLLEISPTEIINHCFTLGMPVTINQRLEADIIELIASEYGYKVKFIDIHEQEIELEDEEPDNPEDLVERPPIVTIMGHVDHGKTSLLDYIRSTNVVAGEVGGITQHIGAYEVSLENGKKITFLDTPGHEAFTAMRARGAKVTDIAVIVIAADDNVMPQTKEAISHAQAAGVPMIFAINKIDKENANPERIKEQLANMNILVEDWGGEYPCVEVSAKKGLNVDKLLETILLVAELLELKANPKKRAKGTVLEASLDKGRGYVATVLVQDGTLHVGDVMLVGAHYGKIKAMFDERDRRVKEAPPSTPVLVLGLNGPPLAGEKFVVMDSEQEAKRIATRREQIIREQGMRAKKHITLDEIGRRLALGNFKELNIILKADVDGSLEALADALLKLSTEEVQINIIHKAVGQITESDVLLASASDAIIIGFQVRPSVSARKLAEKENIDIHLYSIIYDAIEEVKSALEGMLEPKIEEEILGNAEVREIFKVPKVGTVAGCYVVDGKILRNAKARVIRDGIVIYTGEILSLKRFKDDVKEVKSGYECGIAIKDFNDIKVGDMIEVFQDVSVARTL